MLVPGVTIMLKGLVPIGQSLGFTYPWNVLAKIRYTESDRLIPFLFLFGDYEGRLSAHCHL